MDCLNSKAYGLTQDFIDGPHYISIFGETGENNAIISHGFIFFTPLLNLVYNQELLMLQTMYELSKEMWA